MRESFRTHSATGDKTGYGYLWWIYEAGSLGANYPTLDPMPVYLARGTGGQALYVIPKAEMVVVIRGDTDNGRSVNGRTAWQLVERLVAARQAGAAATPRTVPMVATPLSSNVPAPPEPAVLQLDSPARRRFVGEYLMTEGVISRVFEHENRLFVSMPGQGEAELFAVAPLVFTIKVQAGVTVQFQSAPDGAVTGVEVTIGRQKFTGKRQARLRYAPTGSVSLLRDSG